jgi:hypothetical protein
MVSGAISRSRPTGQARSGPDASRIDRGEFDCPYDPATHRAEYHAWYAGKVAGLRQSTLMWEQTWDRAEAAREEMWERAHPAQSTGETK